MLSLHCGFLELTLGHFHYASIHTFENPSIFMKQDVRCKLHSTQTSLRVKHMALS